MITCVKLPVSYKYRQAWLWVMMMVYLGLFMLTLRSYIIWQSVNLILGLCTLPLVVSVNRHKTGGLRFAIIGLLCLVATLLVPVKTLFYCSILFSVLFLVESMAGKVNLLPIITVVLMSPFAQYLAGIFGFPIRLALTAWAGTIMRLAGSQIAVHGNAIQLNGQEFYVDPACMGMNMMVTSLLACLAITGMVQSRLKRTLPLGFTGVLLLAVFALNLLSNLVRIVVLVQFSILPNHPMHEVTGIVCFAMYVCLPCMLLVKWMVLRFGVAPVLSTQKNTTPKYALWLNVLLACVVAMAAGHVVRTDSRTTEASPMLSKVDGYTVVQADAGIIKLENEASLVYIKPNKDFYHADHNPMICWKGSGYAFEQVSEKIYLGQPMYLATLKKENDTLYTAWWYDNGKHTTVSQLWWRWQMLKGAEPFALINVTATAPALLDKAMAEFLSKNINPQGLLPK